MNWNEYLVAQQKKKKKTVYHMDDTRKDLNSSTNNKLKPGQTGNLLRIKQNKKSKSAKKNPTFWAQMKNANEANGDANGNRIFSGSDSSLFFLWGEGIPGHVIQGWEFMGVGCGVYGISLFGVGSKK